MNGSEIIAIIGIFLCVVWAILSHVFDRKEKKQELEDKQVLENLAKQKIKEINFNGIIKSLGVNGDFVDYLLEQTYSDRLSWRTVSSHDGVAVSFATEVLDGIQVMVCCNKRPVYISQPMLYLTAYDIICDDPKKRFELSVLNVHQDDPIIDLRAKTLFDLAKEKAL